MFYNILDQKRIEILPLFKFFKEKFYLAGGTGLALQLGHRDSVDFDFFTEDPFDTFKLYTEIREIFNGKKISIRELLSQMQSKMPDINQNLILKSLVYFDDVTSEKIIFKNNSAIQFS